MTAVHIQAAEDRAVGAAIRRLQEALGPNGVFAMIALRADIRVRVMVYDLAGRQLTLQEGTDLEDCCDLALTAIREAAGG